MTVLFGRQYKSCSTWTVSYTHLVHTLYESSGQRIMLMEDLFPESMKSIHRDHLGIIEAIKRRDVKAVRKVGKRHFDVDRYICLLYTSFRLPVYCLVSAALLQMKPC